MQNRINHLKTMLNILETEKIEKIVELHWINDIKKQLELQQEIKKLDEKINLIKKEIDFILNY